MYIVHVFMQAVFKMFLTNITLTLSMEEDFEFTFQRGGIIIYFIFEKINLFNNIIL